MPQDGGLVRSRRWNRLQLDRWVRFSAKKSVNKNFLVTFVLCLLFVLRDIDVRLNLRFSPVCRVKASHSGGKKGGRRYSIGLADIFRQKPLPPAPARRFSKTLNLQFHGISAFSYILASETQQFSSSSIFV